MSKEEKLIKHITKEQTQRDTDEQFGIMSKERRAELRKEWEEKYGITDMDTAFERIKVLEKKLKEKEETGLFENIYDILGSIARELLELKLGMIKKETCEKITQEEVDEYLENL